MNRSNRLVLLVLLVLAFGLRLPGLFANTFFADEALFSTWGRLIVSGDPLLATQGVDKPPLLFYSQALFYPLLATPAGWVARLPNLLASMVLVALTGRIVWQLYRDESATLLAVALVSLSPFTIQFAASAFTDPLMVTLVIASCWVETIGFGQVARRRAIPAGVLFGLALATKYQAALFLPLLIGLGWLIGWHWPDWWRWSVAVATVGLIVGGWAMFRPGQSSLLALQWEQYGGVRLIWSWELWPRLQAWAKLASYLFGSAMLTVGLFVLLWRAKTALDRLWLAWLLGYLGLHWLLAIPVWDRYLLPTVPIVAILSGRVISGLFKNQRPWLPYLLVWLCCLSLGPGALAAGRGEFPIGSRPDGDDGAAQIAALLAEAPYGTVLYDHWYSWQWRYYFLGGRVFVSWFYGPAGLVRDLQTFYDGSTALYLVLPNSEAARPVIYALRRAGFNLETIHQTSYVTLYQIGRDSPP